MTKNYKQILRYIIAGISTTLLNVGLYLLLLWGGLAYYYANLIAIILTKIYAYFINKEYVFTSHHNNLKDNLKEIGKYTISRGATGIFDYIFVIFAIEILHLPKTYAKYIATLFVIIFNYILSKKYVFTAKTNND